MKKIIFFALCFNQAIGQNQCKVDSVITYDSKTLEPILKYYQKYNPIKNTYLNINIIYHENSYWDKKTNTWMPQSRMNVHFEDEVHFEEVYEFYNTYKTNLDIGWIKSSKYEYDLSNKIHIRKSFHWNFKDEYWEVDPKYIPTKHKYVESKSTYTSPPSIQKVYTQCDEPKPILERETKTKNQSVIYPNPATNEIQIDLVQYKNLKQIIVSNIKGIEVKNQELMTQESISKINVEDLEKGIYLLTGTDKNNKPIFFTKFEKQ